MTPTPHGQVPDTLIDLIDAYAETRHRYGGIYNARTEAARKTVIEALSGVQALSAAQAVHASVKGAMWFTKKPVTIQAIQWTGDNLREVITFTDGPPDTRSHHAGMAWDAYRDLVARDGLKIYTLEGKMLASPGDWIIRGVKGELYPCKPDIFQETYAAASPTPPAEQAAPKAEPEVGNSGFDYKTAADFLNGKTVSDEAVRKFVATSRWAHDERAALSATLLAMHGVLTSREAEIALLKKALLEAETAPQQEAQEPCPTCAALARTVMLDQVSFDRKPDCYGIRQITDDEGVEEWEDIRTSPDVAREEANDMMATGRGEIYEVVPLYTAPQPAPDCHHRPPCDECCIAAQGGKT